MYVCVCMCVLHSILSDNMDLLTGGSSRATVTMSSFYFPILDISLVLLKKKKKSVARFECCGEMIGMVGEMKI